MTSSDGFSFCSLSRLVPLRAKKKRIGNKFARWKCAHAAVYVGSGRVDDKKLSGKEVGSRWGEESRWFRDSQVKNVDKWCAHARARAFARHRSQTSVYRGKTMNRVFARTCVLTRDPMLAYRANTNAIPLVRLIVLAPRVRSPLCANSVASHVGSRSTKL